MGDRAAPPEFPRGARLNSRALLAMAALAAAFWAFRNGRQALKAALVLLVFEGALRKWVFPGAQDVVYFGKDLLLLGVYGGFLLGDGRRRLRAPQLPVFYALLGAATLFGAMQIFNPRLPNLLVGILGFKAYFFYVPLLWILPASFDSDADLFRFLRRYALLAIPVGLLAAAQFVSPSSSPLNTYARGGAEVSDIATFGSSTRVRVTGTFAYITGFTSYLFANVVSLLALIAAERWRFKRSWMLFGALGLTLFGILMSGSRGPILILVLLLPIYTWLAVLREKGSAKVASRLILSTILIGGIGAYSGSEAVSAWVGRATGSGTADVVERLSLPLVAPLGVLDRAGLFGYGIGSTHQMAEAVVHGPRPFYWLEGPNTEIESARVMLELGPLGYLLSYLVRFFLIGFAFREAFRLRTQFHRSIAVACLLFFLAMLPGGIVFEVTAGLYYWFFAGLLTTVVALDRVTAPVDLEIRRAPSTRRRLVPPVVSGTAAALAKVEKG